MSIWSRLRNRKHARAARPQPPMLYRISDPAGGPGIVVPPEPSARTMPAPARPYSPDIREAAAAIVAQVEAEAAAARLSAQTQPWWPGDQPGQPLPPAASVPAREVPPPPPAPYSGVSRIMVDQIPTPPPGTDCSYDWAHQRAEYLRRIGAATGTSTAGEQTGFWALPALEPAPPGALPGFHAVREPGTDTPGEAA